MSNLFTAYCDNEGKLICGYCCQRIVNPETLTENGTAKLVQCPHCWKLNKGKTQ